MPYPHIFAALAGDQPASFLDDNFNAAQLLTGKDVASGYAGLDGSGFLASAQIVGGLGYVPASPAALIGYIAGFNLTATGTTLTIAPGSAANSTAAALMIVSSVYTKTTGAWSVGSSGGSLDTGAFTAGNVWYHLYLMRRPDTGVTDYALSLSAAAPTFGVNIPAAYTQYRRIGSLKSDATAIFTDINAFEGVFIWGSPAVSLAGGIIGTAPALVGQAVPTGIIVKVRGTISAFSPTTSTVVFVNCPQQSAVAVSGIFATIIGQAAGFTGASYFEEITNFSAQVRVVSSVANTQVSMSTIGWLDHRGAG